MLHAGPPIEYARMCGPMRGALVGAALLEGWAATPAEAERALAAGEIAVEPCHHHGAVGPMAGVVSPSMPVWQVTDDAGPPRRHAFATLNEGLGKVLRFGAYGPEVIDRLRWMSDVLGPVLDAAIQASEPIDVTTLIGQALAMGDEGHNRSVAASALLARRLAPAIAPLDGAVEVLTFLAGNDHFALNLSMAAAKLCMDAAAHVPDSSLVTVMSRNGVEFGIRVAAPATGGTPPRSARPTACSSPATDPTTPTPTWATRRSPRRWASAGSPWPPRRRSPPSSAAHRPTRWPRAARCAGSRSRRTPPSRCRRSASPAARPASTCSRCSTPASCR